MCGCFIVYLPFNGLHQCSDENQSPDDGEDGDHDIALRLPLVRVPGIIGAAHHPPLILFGIGGWQTQAYHQVSKRI